MENLQKEYNSIVEKYVNKFCKQTELDFVGWAGGEVGGVGSFNDLFLNFEQVKLVVDEDISYGDLINWYDFLLDNQSVKINLKSYVSLLKTYIYYAGFESNIEKFHSYLLQDKEKRFDVYFGFNMPKS